MSKAPNYTSSVIVTDIPIKPRQFPASSFELYATAFRCRDLDLGHMTLKLKSN